MKKLLLIFVLLPLLMLNNCTTRNDISIVNPERSETEIIAEKLQKVIDENKPQMATAYVFDVQSNKWVSEISCQEVKVSHPFVLVCGKYYNLANLVEFKISYYLELYFKY